MISDGLPVPDPAVTLRQMVLPRSALKNELLPVGAPGGESTAVENHHSQSHLFAERSESVLGLESSTQRRCVVQTPLQHVPRSTEETCRGAATGGALYF